MVLKVRTFSPPTAILISSCLKELFLGKIKRLESLRNYLKADQEKFWHNY